MPAKRSKQLNPMITIWLLAFISAGLGITLAVLSAYRDYASMMYMATGIIHLVVLVPCMLYTGVSKATMIITSALCVLFPIWGFIIGVACVAAWAILVCSFIWGLVLMVSLRRPVAVAVLLLGGLGANLVWVFSDSFSDFGPLYEPFGQLDPAYSAWYVLMFFAMPLIMYTKPSPRFKGKGICRDCGYSLTGLDPTAVCPECGSPRATSPHAHGA